jgi:hypothetical protein
MRGADLKFESVLVRDSEGDRRYSTTKLPLKLGTGGDCVIRVPGPGSAPVALLDELDGQAFIQPVGRNPALTVNGQALAASRRLGDGDLIGFYGSRIRVAVTESDLLLDIQLEDSAYVTRPPAAADAAADAAEELIAPTAFRRAREVGAIETKSTGWGWRSGVAAGFTVLILLSYLLFSARSIQFHIQPGEPDDFSISGGWFTLPFGDRVLMREGSYTVHVRKEGYFNVDQGLVVDETPSRTVLVEMRKLPGRLSFSVDPAVDALVIVDEVQVGKAPFGPVELEPGVHSVSVAAEGFLPFRDQFAGPGLGLQQEVNVQLVPRWANIEIASEPPGATS